jgi:hypothetical protein
MKPIKNSPDSEENRSIHNMDEATRQRITEIHKTYIFRKKRDSDNEFYPIFNFYQTQSGYPKTDDEAKKEGFILETLTDYPLRPKVKPGLDFIMREHAEKYFKEVIFLGDYIQGRNNSKHLDWEFHRVLLDNETNKEISALIKKHKLEAQRPLILQLLAQVQHYYLERARRSESDDVKKELKIIDKGVDDLITILQRFEGLADPKPGNNRKEPDEIFFKYNNAKVQLKSNRVIFTLLKSLVEKFSEPPIGNLKPSVRNIADMFKHFHKNHRYTERLTIALHNWLTETGLIPKKEKAKTSNSALQFIAGFFKIAGILSEEEFAAGSDEIKNLRNYIIRNTLEENPEIVVFPHDLSRLEKHFPPELLKLTRKTKPVDNLHTAYNIVERFELPALFEDLTQLIEALENMRKLPHFNTLLIPNINHNAAEIPDVVAFDRLLQLSKKDILASEFGGINSLSYTCKGSVRVHQISQEIPLSIIQKALKEYASNHPEELSFDLVAHEIYYRNPGDPMPFFKHKNEFNPSGKRFFPTICKGIYNYLLEFAPPEGNASPKQKYFQIIAVIFISCFADELWDADQERKMVEKVAEWYELSQQSEG